MTIGDVSRDPLAADPAGLVFYPIAKYAICVVTNKSNTLSNLTPVAAGLDLHRQNAQLERGPRRDRQRHDRPDQPHLGGGRAHELPDAAAGRQESLRHVAAEETSEGLLKQEVENDPNAIGFLSNYQSDKGGVNVVALNGVACNGRPHLGPVRRASRASTR